MDTVSIVIVSYRVCEYLRACLQSVFEGGQNSPQEVWVVDNASGDGSVEMVQREFPSVHLIVNARNTGFAKACNQALAQARGEFLLLMNPDAVLQENYLAAIKFLRERPEVGIVGGAIINPDGTLDPASHRGAPTPTAMIAKALRLDKLFPRSRVLARYNMLWLPPDEEAEVEAVSGSFLFIRRGVLETIGFLDERFFLYFEDSDYCVRAREAGWKIFYYPRAKVLHHKRASSRHNPDLARLALYHSYITYYDKHLFSSPLCQWCLRGLLFLHSRLDRRVLASTQEFSASCSEGDQDKDG